MRKLLFVSLVITGLTTYSHATSIRIRDKPVLVYTQDGLQVVSGTQTAESLPMAANMAIRFGTFTGGFCPTTSNAAEWFTNFVGVNGAVNLGSGIVAGHYQLSAYINAGDGNLINSPVTSNSGVQETGSIGIPTGAQLYVVLWLSKYIPNTIGGNSFDPFLPAQQAAVLTDLDWIMITSSSSDSNLTSYSFSDSTTAMVGSYDAANKYVTLQSVPEPSSLSLLVLGGVVVALGRRRR